MKILHLTQNYFPSIGGTQHTIKKVSEYLHHNYNDEVTVYTSNSYFGPNRPQFKKINEKEEDINGIKIKRFPFLKMHKPVLKLLSKISAKGFKRSIPERLQNLQVGPLSYSMLRAVNTADADVIGASSIHYLFADYPVRRRFSSRPKPFVLYGALHLHSEQLPKQYKKRIAAADYYIANTSFEKKFLIDAGFEEEKIKVIGTATDILEKADFSINAGQIKSSYKIPKEKFVITYIGRQETSKSIGVLIEAFINVTAKFENVCLIIAGAKGTYTNALEKNIASHKDIYLINDISDEQKSGILRFSDILVLPSTEESFGVVFIEAWSFSKPVIGADIKAIASLIENEKDGLLFEPGNTKNLSQKIELLLKDEPLRKKLGENGHKKFKENYTWDIVAAKYREVYQLAIDKFKKNKN